MYWYEEPVDDVSEPERAWSWKAMVGCKWEAEAGSVESKDQNASARRRRMSDNVESEQAVATKAVGGVWVSMLTLCCVDKWVVV
jgi:hypothetical protein